MKDEKELEAFSVDDRDFNLKAWYLKNDKGNALIEVSYKGEIKKSFTYPAYKIWNLAAHFSDIVDSEIANNNRGYEIAGSNGLGGYIMPKPLSS